MENILENCFPKDMVINNGLVHALTLLLVEFLAEQWIQLSTIGRIKQSNVITLWGISIILTIFRGSISKVMGNDSIGISASYDATMILWDLSRK